MREILSTLGASWRFYRRGGDTHCEIIRRGDGAVLADATGGTEADALVAAARLAESGTTLSPAERAVSAGLKAKLAEAEAEIVRLRALAGESGGDPEDPEEPQVQAEADITRRRTGAAA